MTMLPVAALGKSLTEFRGQLGLSEQGIRTDIDDNTEAWAFRESGVAAKLKNGVVSAIFLYSEGHEGFAEFQGETAGLRLGSSRQVIRYKLGYPSKHQEGATSTVLDTFPNYDRYDYDDYSLHCQYDEAGTRLNMLTVMSPDEVRRIDAKPAIPNRPVVYDKAKYHLDSIKEFGLAEEQSAVHTAFFLGWLMDNDLCSAEFIDDSREDIAAYKRRETTALEVYARKATLTSAPGNTSTISSNCWHASCQANITYRIRGKTSRRLTTGSANDMRIGRALIGLRTGARLTVVAVRNPAGRGRKKDAYRKRNRRMKPHQGSVKRQGRRKQKRRQGELRHTDRVPANFSGS